MRNKKALRIILTILIIAGFATTPLPYCSYGWIPGVLFLLSSVSGITLLVSSLTSQVDSLDKKLSANWREQLSILFEVAGLIFLLFIGIVLIWHPGFHDVHQNGPSFTTLIHVAHRYAGYNYYDDTLGLNTFLLFCSFLGAILFGGLLITTFTNIVQEKKEKYLAGSVIYKRIKGHYVVLGFSEVIFTLCKELLDNNSFRLIILSNVDTPIVRSKLKAKLPNDIFERIIIYSGDTDEPGSLAQLNIDECKEVYILGEEDSVGHDSINLNVLRQLIGFLPDGYTGRLKVNLQMDSQSSFSVIQKLNVPDKYVKKNNKTVIDLHTFNIYENQARRLWGYYKDEGTWDIDFADLDGPKLLPGSKKRVNLVIAGFDRMGQALLLEALRICHFPNYSEKSKSVKTVITLFDNKMNELWTQFIARYPNILKIEDIEIYHYEESLESPLAREILDNYAKDENELLTVAVCFWNPDDSFASGLSLPESLYFKVKDGVASNNEHVRILIRNESNTGIQEIIAEDAKGPSRYKNVKFFGSIEDGLSQSLLDDKAAILSNAHFDTAFEPKLEQKANIYKELTAKYGALEAKETNQEDLPNYSLLSIYKEGRISAAEVLDDWARRFWDETSENHRFSNRYQIEMFGIYERYLPCLKNCYKDKYKEIISQMEHLRWCAERLIMGYRLEKYNSDSPVKNEKDSWRVHTDLLPFGELTDKDKAKDLVFLTIDATKSIIASVNNNK